MTDRLKHKFKLWLFALFCLCACWSAVAHAGDDTTVEKVYDKLLAGKEPVKVVCFGDSVTGVYYHTGSRRAYTDMLEIALERTFPQASITAINAGISGHTTRHALARIERDVLAHEPDLVTIMFGLNDMVGIPLDEYQKNLIEIIKRCRDIGAEVLLCTPNSVTDTSGRPTNKLERYVAAVRGVGKSKNVPVVDCYRAFQAVRAKEAFEWFLLMSDEIHPNMDGHKKIADEIARAVSAGAVSVRDVPPPQPAILRTLERLNKQQPVRVYAMPPFDKLIAPVLKHLDSSAQVEVTTWPTAGQTLADLEQASKGVRKMGVDLVLIAAPAAVSPEKSETSVRSFTWTMNWSLNFGPPTWDCVVISPAVVQPDLNGDDTDRSQLITRLVRAQDLSLIKREPNDNSPPKKLLVDWLRSQFALAKAADR